MVAAIAAIDMVLDRTDAALRGFRRILQAHNAKWTAALDAAKERYEYQREVNAAWAWYEGRDACYVQPQTMGEVEQYEATRRKRARRAARRERR